ncbi:hypothetical protein Clacol_002120 [Clathrus columnatus]|uniref:Uncharacterized protein n=1 Tax=Clathrus columnatus TaxID=1419009 RepID=A0AAV5A578_9AGAM|nr:hypothetical protein Clacol_002120 [Clathrus columnatus]
MGNQAWNKPKLVGRVTFSVPSPQLSTWSPRNQDESSVSQCCPAWSQGGTENNYALRPSQAARSDYWDILLGSEAPIQIQSWRSLANSNASEASLVVRLGFVHNIAIILSDILAFIAVVRQVWGLWKLRLSLGLRSNQDLVKSLFQQDSAQIASDLLGPIQDVLSSLLICEFTLDLRRRNASSAPLNQSAALDLPTLSFQENPAQSIRTVLGQLHQSIVAEMGERNDLEDSIMDGPISGELLDDSELQDTPGGNTDLDAISN